MQLISTKHLPTGITIEHQLKGNKINISVLPTLRGYTVSQTKIKLMNLIQISNIKKELGYTPEVDLALDLIKRNHLLPSSRSQTTIRNMVGKLYQIRHTIGLNYALNQFKIYKTALKILTKNG
tara:strand:+ start:97 stop:465 length:369 start_codon:yes stop_codon:yes gene_type:complete